MLLYNCLLGSRDSRRLGLGANQLAPFCTSAYKLGTQLQNVARATGAPPLGWMRCVWLHVCRRSERHPTHTARAPGILKPPRPRACSMAGLRSNSPNCDSTPTGCLASLSARLVCMHTGQHGRRANATATPQQLDRTPSLPPPLSPVDSPVHGAAAPSLALCTGLAQGRGIRSQAPAARWCAARRSLVDAVHDRARLPALPTPSIGCSLCLCRAGPRARCTGLPWHLAGLVALAASYVVC